MTTYSENYNFALPEDEDGYDIAPVSENFDAIDAILAENEGQMAEINEKIGTPAETGQTLFSLLNNNSDEGVRTVKSIQRAHYKYGDTKTISINTVDPTRCIVITERYHVENTNIPYMSYELSKNTLTVSHGGGEFSFVFRAYFWIIEFY